jgi:thioredoxin
MGSVVGKVALAVVAAYALHRFSVARLGGGCPLICSPWRAVAMGVVFGLLWAWTPSPAQGPAAAVAEGALSERLRAVARSGEQQTMDVKVEAGVPVKVSEAALVELVKISQVPILLDAYADWCGPCRMLAPHLEEVAKDYAGRLVVAKLNVDESPQVAQALNIRGIPAMFLITGDKVVDGWTGFASAEQIKARLDPRLSTTPS